MSSFYDRSIELHRRLHGKIALQSKVDVDNIDDLSLAYTPGVAAPCELIHKDPSLARELTIKHNTVAVLTDGSAVLGLGNIGPHAALPVMEGKALLFKKFADVDAFPICLDTQDTAEIIRAVRQIAPVFGGINLEDIAAPRCFEVESALQDLGIPVFHDDQHGTAIVLMAALINACKVTGRQFSDLKVVVNGAGAAGFAITKLLLGIGYEGSGLEKVRDVIVCDSRGIIGPKRQELPTLKRSLLDYTNRERRDGDLKAAIAGADVFVGVSRGNLLKADDVKSMADKPILFAMANPIPEIMPDEAYNGGAGVVGTGRSDFPNQVNNVLVFPGLFRGALDIQAAAITPSMKAAAVHALVAAVPEPNRDRVIPSPFDLEIPKKIAEAVRNTTTA